MRESKIAECPDCGISHPLDKWLIHPLPRDYLVEPKIKQMIHICKHCGFVILSYPDYHMYVSSYFPEEKTRHDRF